MICDGCTHNRVCRNEESMRKFAEEISKMLENKEYQTFNADLKCEHYYDDKKFSLYRNESMRTNQDFR